MNRVYLFVMVLFLFCFFAACATPPAVNSATLHFAAESDAGPVQSNLYQLESQGDSYTDTAAYQVNQANVYQTEETIMHQGLSIEGIAIRTGKALPEDVDKENFLFFDLDQIDDLGTLQNETSFLFIDLSAKNTGNAPLLISWNATTVLITDSDGNLIAEPTLTSWEARYRSGKDRDEARKDYYVQTLEAGEATSLTLGYVIDDTAIHSERLYFAPTSGLADEPLSSWKIYQLNPPSAVD